MPLPVFDNEQYLWLLGQRRRNAANQLSQQYFINEAEERALGGQASLLNARRTALGARAATVGAGAGVIAASRGVNAANAAVLSREGEQLAATRGVIGLQQQQAGERAADVSLIRKARANVADKAAVATEALARSQEDKLYARVGLAAPVDVDVPAGAEGQLTPGTRASLKTQEDIVRGEVADREVDRNAALENARLAVSMSATNVTEAELMARRAGLTLAEARLMVNQAELGEQVAQLGVAGAQLNTQADDLELARLGIGLNRTKLAGALNQQYLTEMKAPEDEGFVMYRDPDTRELSWLTPAEADEREFAYQTRLTRERLPVSISLANERRQATQQAAVNENPFAFFDDSDFVQYLLPGVEGRPSSLDPSQPSATVLRNRVYEALLQKYGGDAGAASIKFQQYLNAVQVLKARLADEQGQLEQ